MIRPRVIPTTYAGSEMTHAVEGLYAQHSNPTMDAMARS